MFTESNGIMAFSEGIVLVDGALPKMERLMKARVFSAIAVPESIEAAFPGGQLYRDTIDHGPQDKTVLVFLGASGEFAVAAEWGPIAELPAAGLDESHEKLMRSAIATRIL